MSTFVEALRVVQQIPPTGAEVGSDARNGLRHWPGDPGLALMWMFGLVYLEERSTEAGEPWTVDRIDLPAFGKTLLRRLGRALIEKQEALKQENPLDVWTQGVDVGTLELTREELQHVFQSYFPDWERPLTALDTSFTPGVHTLHVQVDASPYDGGGALEARIAAPGDAELDALAQAILEAAMFDRDHLYAFQFDDAHDRMQTVPAPKTTLGPPYTDETRLGDLPLDEGASLTFRFDFGAEWRFGIEVESIEPSDDGPAEVRILDVTDDTPEQYPSS